MITIYNMKTQETREPKNVGEARDILKLWKKIGTRKDEVCISGAFEGTLLKGIFYNIDSGNGKPVPDCLQFSLTKVNRSYVGLKYDIAGEIKDFYMEFRKSLLRTYQDPEKAIKIQGLRFLKSQNIQLQNENRVIIPLRIQDRLSKM